MAKLNLKFYKGQDCYSDGDVENIILDIIKKEKNFQEIVYNISNWAILYHFLPNRENILDWYDFDNKASLLEIGAGCGALTGLFARKVKNVTAIELSKRRSEIIYHRYKDFFNIEIIVGNLNDIVLDTKFDYVTLIGVLEYAARFTPGKEPFKIFLDNIKQYLKDDGTLLIAIENKFGLKYWAGAREDHTGKFFESIEGYSPYTQIRTFGKIELEELLRSVGFKFLNFYYPMPDYKLPKVIYSDSYLPKINDFFDIYSPNLDRDRCVLFDERKVFKNIIENKQFPFFANSFLVEARL